MNWDVAGIGNALMDALVVLDDDALLEELGLTRGTMHPVDHERWQSAYERVRRHDVIFDSGGSCANTVATVGRLGGRAVYCGQVGDDQMGQLYASLLEKACGSHALRFAVGQPTGKCLSIISARDAERTMLTHLGAAVSLPELGDFAEEVRRARIAHFTGYTLLDGPMRDVVLEAMAVASAAGTMVSLDAADPFVVMQIRDELWSAIQKFASIVFLNAEEAVNLAGVATPEEACVAIAERGEVDTVAVKLGSKGSIVWHRGEVVPIQVYKVDAIDTTGAGDAFAGGFLYGLAKGWDAQRSGRLASAVAGLAVAQVGAVVKDLDALHAVLGDAGKAA